MSLLDAPTLAPPPRGEGPLLDQAALDLLAQAVGHVRRAAGWRTDIGAHVLTEDADEAPEDAAEFVEILDQEETLNDQGPARRQSRLTVRLVANIPVAGAANKARAHAREVFADLRDVVRLLAQAPRGTLPAGVTGLALGDRTLSADTRYAGWLEASQLVTLDLTETYPPRRN